MKHKPVSRVDILLAAGEAGPVARIFADLAKAGEKLRAFANAVDTCRWCGAPRTCCAKAKHEQRDVPAADGRG